VLGVDASASPAPADSAATLTATGAHPPPPGGHGIFEQLPSLDELERQYLQYVLDYTKGHRTKTAKIMQIDRKRLYRMAQRHGVSLDRLP